MTAGAILARLDARDRALFTRWSLVTRAASMRQRLTLWRTITHGGGVTISVAAALIPLWIGNGALRAAAGPAAVGLALSHFTIQLVKRFVGRPRPSRRTGYMALIAEPACFSLPSGHATAVMSLAFSYSMAYPLAAPWLLFSAATVGFSRVRLGVHYPGDVLAGQVIAIGTDVVVRALW